MTNGPLPNSRFYNSPPPFVYIPRLIEFTTLEANPLTLLIPHIMENKTTFSLLILTHCPTYSIRLWSSVSLEMDDSSGKTRVEPNFKSANLTIPSLQVNTAIQASIASLQLCSWFWESLLMFYHELCKNDENSRKRKSNVDIMD